MKTRKELIKELQKEKQLLEKKVNNKKLYNIRNFFMLSIIKSGIAAEYLLPFIFSGLIIGKIASERGNKPFHRDYIEQKAHIQQIDTSYGMHMEKISYEPFYNNLKIEYNTGWIINNKMYERTVYTYEPCDKMDIKNILNQSKEEIEKELLIKNKKIIIKKNLEPLDKLYEKEGIILTTTQISDENKIYRLETTTENINNSALFVIMVLLLGESLELSKLIIYKNKLSLIDKLKYYESKFKMINEEEEKILRIKKQNLRLLQNNKKKE